MKLLLATLLFAISYAQTDVMSIYRASVRASKQLSTRCVRACSGVVVEISDIEKAAGHGRTQPWHYTVPVDFKDTRSDLHKAQHRGDTPDYDKKKGAVRVEGRLKGIEVPQFCGIEVMENREALEAKVDALKDEDGIFHAPHVKEMPSMTFNDTMVNYHFDYIGLKSPEFGEAQISEIESKTTISRDNIHHARYEWLNQDVDLIDYGAICGDLDELYKKGVSYRTINMWLDYISGSGSSYSDSIVNRNWVRIDS